MPSNSRFPAETSLSAPNTFPFSGYQGPSPNLGTSPGVSPGKTYHLGSFLLAEDARPLSVTVPAISAGAQSLSTQTITFTGIPEAQPLTVAPPSVGLSSVYIVPNAIAVFSVWAQVNSYTASGLVVTTQVQPIVTDSIGTTYKGSLLPGGVTYVRFQASITTVLSAIAAVAAGPIVSLTVYGTLNLAFPPKKGV